MNGKRMAWLAVLAALAVPWTSARAQVGIGVRIGGPGFRGYYRPYGPYYRHYYPGAVGIYIGPGYYPPPPVIVAPPPPPAVVVTAPPPPPVVIQQPAPAPVNPPPSAEQIPVPRQVPVR